MQQMQRQLTKFSALVEQDPELQDQMKTDPVRTIKRLKSLAGALPQPLMYDVWIYRSVVWALGLTILAAVIGAVMLAARGKKSPEILIARQRLEQLHP